MHECALGGGGLRGDDDDDGSRQAGGGGDVGGRGVIRGTNVAEGADSAGVPAAAPPNSSAAGVITPANGGSLDANKVYIFPAAFYTKFKERSFSDFDVSSALV